MRKLQRQRAQSRRDGLTNSDSIQKSSKDTATSSQGKVFKRRRQQEPEDAKTQKVLLDCYDMMRDAGYLIYIYIYIYIYVYVNDVAYIAIDVQRYYL